MKANIRRWIIENDWLEAIIALPENIFYNTGIATYVWVLTNRKSDERKGTVQLIDATTWYQPLRKNMGKKNCELSEINIQDICDLITRPEETEQSKIFPNEAFGYQKVIVERPLRLSVDLTDKNLHRFERLCIEAKETSLYSVVASVVSKIGVGPHKNYNRFLDAIEAKAGEMSEKLPAKSKKFLKDNLAVVDESAEAVIKKIYKAGKATPNPLYGLYETEIDGKKVVVEYEPDTTLRDSEQIPLLEDGDIASFIEREVLPYTPDAWVDGANTRVGYEISFTKHFYKPIPMRTLEEIKADILAIEQETEGLLEEIIGDAE